MGILRKMTKVNSTGIAHGKACLTLLFIIFCLSAYAQKTAVIYGKITDENGEPLQYVNIGVINLNNSYGTSTDVNGNYQFDVPAGKTLHIQVSMIGYENHLAKLYLTPGSRHQYNKSLPAKITQLPGFEVRDKQLRTQGYRRINKKTAQVIPTLSGDIESIIKTLPGVVSTSELSSQYSVRGGNYDENLVYVNDIQVYRPFLVRAGQQEGLSFVNSDLVSSVLFSAGGFESKYGDKMSSVLDIKYKEPREFKGSVSMSLLGGSFHVEGLIDSTRLTYLLGVRHKRTQYLLNNLETKGDYKPSFTDVQGLISFNPKGKWKFSFLGNYSRNSYSLIPETRETNFGSITQALRLRIYFDGQELDLFNTYFGAFTAEYSKDTGTTTYKIIASAFNTIESETYDIQGQYWLYQLEVDFGEDDFGQEAFTRGVGTFLNHARNYLDASVYNTQFRASYIRKNSYTDWGFNLQREYITDRISEWELLDSSGYTLPNPPDSIAYTDPGAQPDHPLELFEVLKTENILQATRLSGFVQNSLNFDRDSSQFSVTSGVRFHYWDVNKDLLISPRISAAFEPNWKNEMVFRFSAGYYYQPPFYRELRDFDGSLNKNIKAQRSIHLLAGSDLYFQAWNRPFKFVTEIYYKFLNDLIPYEVDNLLIRYYPDETSHGYAAGIDFRVNGEFVSGVESWASLSILKTEEDIEGDGHGYVPRPSDQRVTVNLFFQDYLPKNSTFKMHLNLVFGSSLPFGAPQTPKYTHTLRMPTYRRVDIGFSKELVTSGGIKRKGFFGDIASMWVSLEVLNLLQVSNTISYIWVRDITNLQYPVPNYLTPRQLNLRLNARF